VAKPKKEFHEFIDPSDWRTFEEHARRIPAELEQDVAKLAEENRTIRKEARKMLQAEFPLTKVTEKDLNWAEEQLFGESVCAIDGTHALYPMLSGIRCQIGVAATSYRNRRTEGVVFVSEQQIKSEDTTVLGILKRRKSGEKVISRLLIRAIMFYMERAKALERREPWIMFNGPLVPYELRTGLGSFRALDPCLTICERVIDRETVVGVIADTTDDELLSLGLAMEPGEYVRVRSYKVDLDEYLESSGLRGNDRARMGGFSDHYGVKVDVGIYRAGARAYLFQAHADYFDEAAKIVMRDSMFQPLRSYPLLIDYADALCSRMLSSSDFRRQLDFKLAKHGNLEFEQSELDLRRR
jgi:hypothetical protein